MTIPTGVILVVADTNILVSALLTDGPPARIVDLIAEGKIRPCFDDRILAEYWDVLSRPKFGFPSARINRLIHDIVRTGFGIDAVSSPGEISMPDESDLTNLRFVFDFGFKVSKFYDIAKAADAILITAI